MSEVLVRKRFHLRDRSAPASLSKLPAAVVAFALAPDVTAPPRPGNAVAGRSGTTTIEITRMPANLAVYTPGLEKAPAAL